MAGAVRRFAANIAKLSRDIRPTVEYFAGRLRGPKWLYFEFVNTCNANCVFCAYRYDPRPKLTLGLDRVVTAAKQFPRNRGDVGRLESAPW